jgi:hypothetical protein
VQTTRRSAGSAQDGSRHYRLLAVILLCSPLLIVEAVVLSTRNPSSLLLPVGVFAVANALLLSPALPRRVRWSSWTATARHRHADSAR